MALQCKVRRVTHDPQGSEPNPTNGDAGSADAQADAASSEISALKAERDKLRDQLLRTAADFDNFRKRAKRDLDDARLRGKDDLIRELLPVFDNLERAVQSAGGASDVKSLVDGVKMVLKMFEDTAERVGLHRIKTMGERFDPAMHEALQQVESAEHAPGTIVAEIAAGYRFGERLVRPAMVVVARKTASTPPAGGAGAAKATDSTDGPAPSSAAQDGTSPAPDEKPTNGTGSAE